MADSVQRVWDVVEKVGVGMLTTQFGGGLRARPLEPRVDRDEATIRFVTDARGAKDDELAAAPDACLIVIDPKDKAYLSITGRAAVFADPELASQIWRRTDDVWWPDGPADPNVRVLEFYPATAELWDGPASKIVAAFEFAKARMTGGKPNLGENRKVTVKL
jgi:general stress protein 26